tara:strand:+ start:935 stop:1525 length:591 start_codon:yes stop_codon:yes gene_type:complete
MNYCLIKDAWGEDFCDSTKQSNTYHIFEKPLEYVKKNNIEEEEKVLLEDIQPNNMNSNYFVYDSNNDSTSSNLETDLDKKDKNNRKQYTYWYKKNKHDLEQQVLITDEFRKNIKNVLKIKKNNDVKKAYNKKRDSLKKKNKKTGGNIKKRINLKSGFRGGNVLDFNNFYTIDYILLGILLIFIIDIFYKIEPHKLK